ncbi:MAG: Gfo/Idh/MocA family oxidoreductase [Candidatus Zixiibacteriota bacterium]|nr:MAG: Gfo/Idh/MocA family oxidoreductase [candidate division Zixibacteria bacterium]
MKIGVIGCGYWGPNLIRNCHELDGVSVTGVCDIRENRLQFISRQYPSLQLLTTSADEVIQSAITDAIIVSTPVSTHYELGQQVLKAGKHLLLEKPFTSTVDEAKKLIDTADKAGLCLMVDHTFVYTGAVKKIKELIDSGELGQLYYFDSTRVNLGLFQHDVNVVWDLAPHDVSIMDYLLGQIPRAIAATGMAHFDNRIENMAYISAYYDNNLLGHIHVNWLAPVKVRKTLISGSKKMVIYDDMEPSEKVKVYDRGVDISQDKEQIYRLLVQYRTGDMLAPNLDLTEALKGVSREFVTSIREPRAPLTGGEAGLRVVRILEAANRSMRRNGELVKLG